MKKFHLYFISALTLLFSCTSETKNTTSETPAPSTNKKEELVEPVHYAVTAKLPHDENAFTEGLLFHDNKLYESTGSPENLPQTNSGFGIVDTTTGKLNMKVNMGRKYFGEGIVIINNKIFQLTYTEQVGFIYDAKTYKQIGQFTFKNKEGWGMTTDGKSIIMSDGTNVLTYMNPNTLQVEKTLSVTNGGYAEDYLNELEYINGYIYANIWMKNYAVKIDTKTGKVVGLLDFSPLMAEAKSKNPHSDVLNGIAYDSSSKKMYVTGKMFPYIYELELKN
jgi:glutamine cyclotransferase